MTAASTTSSVAAGSPATASSSEPLKVASTQLSSGSITGNTVITGDATGTALTVAGNGGTALAVQSGSLTVGEGNSATVLASNGDAAVGRNLTVSGETTLNGNTTVNGQTTLNGGLKVASGAPVDMGGNVVSGVANPVLGTDAANKRYVDSALNSASKRMDKLQSGIAIASAFQAPLFQPGQSVAVRGGWGSFEGSSAFSLSAAGVISRSVFGSGMTATLDGGVGVGLDGAVAGKAGVTFGW